MERFLGDRSYQFGSSDILRESSSSSVSILGTPALVQSVSQQILDISCFDVSADIDGDVSPQS